MLSIVLFKAREVAFEAVSGFGYFRVVEVVKHVWQGFEEHASGSFEIAEDPSTLRYLEEFLSVTIFPVFKVGNEVVAFFNGIDVGHEEEDFTQQFCIMAFRAHAAPHEALTLNMDQTSLDDDLGPNGPEGSDDVRIAVHSAAAGIEASVLEGLKKGCELAL
ncbi:MAG TPA: hypothetical protein PLZ86_07850 [bacterium]|nr:hypothetical protein [bacterium]